MPIASNFIRSGITSVSKMAAAPMARLLICMVKSCRKQRLRHRIPRAKRLVTSQSNCRCHWHLRPVFEFELSESDDDVDVDVDVDDSDDTKDSKSVAEHEGQATSERLCCVKYACSDDSKR